MVDPIEIKLGDDTYRVVAQPHPRIWRQLPQVLQGIDAGDLAGADSLEELVTALGDRTHAAMRIFVPDLMPLYKWQGFVTNAAMEAREFDLEQCSGAPTHPQIMDAFEAAVKANGGERFGRLVGKALGPELAGILRETVATQLSRFLRSSLPASGGSAPTSSGPKSPTPAPPDLEG